MKGVCGRFMASLGMLAAMVFANGAVSAATTVRTSLAEELRTLPPGMVDWHRVDSLVTHALLTEERKAVEADLALAPASLAVLLAQFDLQLRAGHDRQTRAVFDRLCKRQDFRAPEVARPVASVLWYRGKWDLGTEVLELCPAIGPGLGQHIVSYVAKKRGKDAAEELLEQAAAGGDEGWLRAWVFFLEQHGGADSVVGKLEAAVRAQPASLPRARAYLKAVEGKDRRRDLNWMGRVCRPPSAFDSYLLGRSLLEAKAYTGAVALLRRSLALKVTPQDRARISGWTQAEIAHPEDALRAWTKRALVEAYQALGRNDLARPIIKELARGERARGGVTPETSRMAAMAQAEAPERPVERMLREDEQTNKDSPRYWLARAEYYAGGRDDAQARAAYNKALQLAPTGPPFERSKGGSQRYQVVAAYARYLQSREQWADMERLLRAELQQAPYGCDSRQFALLMLLHLAPQGHATIAWDDDLLWKTLATNERWDSHEDSLLDRMLRRCPTAQKDAAISRAETLCMGTDPSRAVVLGVLLSRRGSYHRAVALLRPAVPRLTASERRPEQEQAKWELFGAYVHLGRPDEAEAQFEGMTDTLDGERIVAGLKAIASAAAHIGDSATAMRLWRRAANVDAIYVHDPRALAELGLREDLRRFYREWQRTDPDSWVPAAALKRINEPPIRGVAGE